MSLYSDLEIEKTASADEIKRAYKKLALKCHPDKNAEDPAAEQKFKKITRAYTILSDANKRKRYDDFGVIDDEMPSNGGGGPGVDINDILRSVFGDEGPFGGGGGIPGMPGMGPMPGMPGGFHFMFNGQNMGQHAQPGTYSQTTHQINLHITLEEVYNGVMKRVEFDVMDKCSQCQGVGTTDPTSIIKCMRCRGERVVMQQMGPFMMARMPCPSCHGEGSMIPNHKHCSKCKGEKLANTRKTLDIKIPKGIPHGHQHTIEQKGSYSLEAKRNNDVVAVFSYVQEPNITITNSHVTLSIEVTLEELLCGFQKQIMLYGKEHTILSKGYYNPSKPLVIKDGGLPVFKRDGQFGNLTIVTTIIYPEDANGRVLKCQEIFQKVFKRQETASASTSDTSTSAPTSSPTGIVIKMNA